MPSFFIAGDLHPNWIPSTAKTLAGALGGAGNRSCLRASNYLYVADSSKRLRAIRIDGKWLSADDVYNAARAIIGNNSLI